jgi:hypothetical protein
MPVKQIISRLSIFTVLFVCLISCQQQDPKKETNSVNNTELQDSLQGILETEQSLEDFVHSIEGVWVNIEYLNSIKKYKSPYKTQEEHPYYEVFIDSKNVQNNLIGFYDYEYGQTESSTLHYFDWKNKQLIYKHSIFDGKKLGNNYSQHFKKIDFIVQNNDTILRIVKHDNLKVQLKKVKNTCKEDVFDESINYFISATILQGKYKILDENKTPLNKSISVDKFGKINGYPPFYRIILWNFFREMNGIFEHDVIEIVTQKNKNEEFGFYRESVENLYKFEYKKDTLKLREIFYNETENKESFGEVKYYFVSK